jgi:hypothetical protein
MVLVRLVHRAFVARVAILAVLALLVAAGLVAPDARASASAAGSISVPGGTTPVGVIAAAVTDVLCTAGAHGERFQPGLLLTPTTNVLLTGNGILTGCSTPPGSSAPDPLLSHATFTFAGSNITVSCLAGSGTAEFRFRWNDGGTSDATLTVTLNVAPGVGSSFVAQGPVTAGRFRGSVVTATFTLFTTTPQRCAGPPGVQYGSGTMPVSTFTRAGA